MKLSSEQKHGVITLGICGSTALALMIVIGGMEVSAPSPGRQAAVGSGVPERGVLTAADVPLPPAPPVLEPAQQVVDTSSVSAALDAKSIGERFEVIHRDGSVYLVEKVNNLTYKVISTIEAGKTDVRSPLSKKIIPPRYITAIR